MPDELGTERLEHLGNPLEKDREQETDHHLGQQHPHEVRENHHHHLVHPIHHQPTHKEPPYPIQELGHDLDTFGHVLQHLTYDCLERLQKP